jgi:hypothetical protein
MGTPSNPDIHSSGIKANAAREPINADSSMLMLLRRLWPPEKWKGKRGNYESVMVAKVHLVVRKSRVIDRYTMGQAPGISSAHSFVSCFRRLIVQLLASLVLC